MNEIAEALENSLISTNVCDSNLEAANIVDVVHSLAMAARKIASAILPADAAAGTCATGGTVDSLTEAVMGVTAGLVRIADSISELADAVRELTS